MAKAGGIRGIIERLSQYDLWNYFFTGAVFFILFDRYTSFGKGTASITYNWYFEILVFAFIGMLINRIGSIFNKIFDGIFGKKQEQFAEIKGADTPTTYEQFIEAAQKDEMIITFWDRGSLFRSCAAMLTLFAIIRAIDIFPRCLCHDRIVLLSATGAILMVISYLNAEKTLRRRINIIAPVKPAEAKKKLKESSCVIKLFGLHKK